MKIKTCILITFELLVVNVVFSANPLDVADSLYNLAYNYQEMGRYRDAEVLHIEALDIRLRYCDENSIEISQSYRHIGNLYRDMGRYEEAEDYLKKAILSVSDSIEYAKSIISYCSMLIEVNELRKVDSLITKENVLICRVFGEESVRYAAWLRCKGNFYCEKGQLDSALVNYEKAQRIYENVDNKQSLASTYSNISDAYYDYGKYSQALDWSMKGLIARKECFGSHSRPYASSLAQCGLCYYKMSIYTEAERDIMEAMKIYKEAVGENHPDYAKTLHYLANIYQDQGQLSLALKFHTDALKIMQNTFEEVHPNVLRSYNNLANLYRDLGNYQKSESLHLKVLQIRQQQFGADNILCAKSLNNLGALYLDMGDYKKSKLMFAKAAKIFAKELGEGNARYATALNNIANVFLHSNQLDSAQVTYEQIEHIFFMGFVDEEEKAFKAKLKEAVASLNTNNFFNIALVLWLSEKNRIYKTKKLQNFSRIP